MSIVLFPQKNTQSHCSSQVLIFVLPFWLAYVQLSQQHKMQSSSIPNFFSLSNSKSSHKCINSQAPLLNITFSLPPYQTKSSSSLLATAHGSTETSTSTLLLPTLHLHTSIKHPHIHKYIDSHIQTQFISYITGFLYTFYPYIPKSPIKYTCLTTLYLTFSPPFSSLSLSHSLF